MGVAYSPNSRLKLSKLWGVTVLTGGAVLVFLEVSPRVPPPMLLCEAAPRSGGRNEKRRLKNFPVLTVLLVLSAVWTGLL